MPGDIQNVESHPDIEYSVHFLFGSVNAFSVYCYYYSHCY